MKEKKNGFTLIEILIVLVILMSIAGLVGVNVMHHQRESKIKTARIQIAQLRAALQIYYTEQGRLPTMAQGLQALVEKPDRPPVPERYPEFGYLDKRAVPLDPWNNDYIYIVPGRKGEMFEVISYGSDGEPGGTGDAADISSSDAQ